MEKAKGTITLGPKPVRTDETRAALAAVTPARETKAIDLWRAHAPEGAEGMIEATEEPRE